MQLKKFKQINFSDLKNMAEEDLRGAVIVGLDIDWASDFIMEDTLKLAYECGVNPTLFLTHQSPLLEKIFKEEKYEFGLHPNFEKLLDGDNSNGSNSADVLDRLIKHFPNVDIVRSHSLTTSSRLKALFKSKNFSFESSFITHGTNGKFPNFWREWNDMVHVPITWEDDVWFTLEGSEISAHPSNVLRPDMLNVLTFHPVHLFLNTTDEAHYNSSREVFSEPEKLIKLRKDKEFGVRDIFKNIGKTIAGNY